MPIELRQTHPTEASALTRALEIELGPTGVTSQDRIFFTERLALLLDTGTPLHTSLETLAGQVSSPAMKQVMGDLQDDVTGGMSFSQALASHPEAFPNAYVSVVAAGEEGGFLPEVLERLRELDEKRQELRSTLLSAFTYPAFLIVFSLAVVAFVLMVVFPKFGEMFRMIWDQLPVTTRFLMTTSQVMLDHWAVIGVATVGGAVGLGWWVTQPAGREALEGVGLRIPALRDVIVQFQLVQFMHVMALALGNGVPMVDALRSCREVVGSPRFRAFVESLEDGVMEGRGIASGFREAEFVPPLIRQMVATGEESGRLAMVMDRMARFYEREWRQRLTLMAKLVEPAMLVVMGLVVGVIVSSLILPIFKLSTTVH